MLLPILTLPMTFRLIREIKGKYTDSELNQTLGGTAKLSLFFSLLFSLGFILS